MFIAWMATIKTRGGEPLCACEHALAGKMPALPAVESNHKRLRKPSSMPICGSHPNSARAREMSET
jgi:hypothetical protein